MPDQIEPAAENERDAGFFHYCFDLLPIEWFVAMNRAFFTHWFGIQGTFVEPFERVLKHIRTIVAQLIKSVFFSAIDLNKGPQDFFVLFYPLQ